MTRPRLSTQRFSLPRLRDVGWMLLLLAAATLVGYVFDMMGLVTENITSAYILATLVCAVVTANLPVSALMSVAGVVLFNFCFATPRYTLAFAPVYGPTFVVMLVTALLASTLANLLHEQARRATQAIREREETALIAKNEQTRANLLRSIGHDLRTPLTSISGAASLLQSDLDRIDPAKRHELLADIEENASWLSNLVENLLAVTRVENGTLRLQSEPELLDEVVAEAIGHLPDTGARRRVTVRTDDGVLMAKMDARLIMQVVVNLLDNAAKYAPAETPVTVTVRRDGADVTCEVADEGPGIPDAEKGRVFEQFYTVHGVTPVDGRRSLGLGLALCRSIVEAHGGRIWARDNEPTGAVFAFSLPAYDPPGLDGIA